MTAEEKQQIVNEVLAVMVSVGAVASVSLVTVIPAGLITSARSTVAGICSAPRMAMTCVVQEPALAAFVEPRKV